MAAGTDIYDDVLAAMPIDPGGILAFRLPRVYQRRVTTLTNRRKAGTLTPDEDVQLQRFLALEATLRALKGKALLAESAGR